MKRPYKERRRLCLYRRGDSRIARDTVSPTAKAGWMENGIVPSTVGADDSAARAQVTTTTKGECMASGIINHPQPTIPFIITATG